MESKTTSRPPQTIAHPGHPLARKRVSLTCLLICIGTLSLPGCVTTGGEKGIFDLKSLSISSQDECRTYNSDIYHGDKMETETGLACLNEDGTWKPTPNTPSRSGSL